MKQNKVPKIEYSGKEPSSKRSNPYKHDVIYSNLGQWKYPGQVTRIPSGNITMQGVPYPVYGEDNLGHGQMMYPGMDYQFPGQYVTEYPIVKNSGWLDEYQSGGSKNPEWYNGKIASGIKYPIPPADKRRIPQSGIVVDKRTNQAYYFGDKGETGTFPVLTGKNPEGNVNTYSLEQLKANSKLRNTPTGYYTVNKESTYKTPEMLQHYAGRMRDVEPISAYGVPAPHSKDLGFHLTYMDPFNPAVYKNRDSLYRGKETDRNASYGCVNCERESYDAFNRAIPKTDTMMVLDSKNYADKLLLEQAKNRMKTKPLMQKGGTKIHTDKAAFDKAYKAEMDSLKAYKLGEKRFNAQQEAFNKYANKNNVSMQTFTNFAFDKKHKFNKPGQTNFPISETYIMGILDPSIEPYINNISDKSLWNNIPASAYTRSTDERDLIAVDRYKKPVIHNIYQPFVEPPQDTIKPTIAPVNTPVYHPVYQQEIPGIKKSKQVVKVEKDGGWLDEMQEGGNIDISKVRMDFYPKSQIEAEVKIKKGLINTKRKVDKNGDDEGENLFEIFDPTGISSWNDVKNEYKRTGISPETTLEVLGAIPMLGKVAKLLKNAPKAFKGIQGYEKINQNRHLIGDLLNNASKAGRVSDGYQYLDSDYDAYKRGGQKGLKHFTSKNIQSSVNDIMMRNETLFGPAGKRRYKPGLKYKHGGNWLDNLH